MGSRSACKTKAVLNAGDRHQPRDEGRSRPRPQTVRGSRFPAYAPELSPAEGVWNDFKRHIGNSILRGKQDIRLNLHASTRWVRRSPDKLRSFVLVSNLLSAPRQ